jgi:hypothetical protein
MRPGGHADHHGVRLDITGDHGTGADDRPCTDPMPGSTRAPSPIIASSPTVTAPPSTAPGATCTNLPIEQS